jgi:hypothetical protein
MTTAAPATCPALAGTRLLTDSDGLTRPAPARASGRAKPHSDEAGYRAEARNPLSGGHGVVYVADDQGIDVDGNRYAVVCCVHATIVGTNSLRDAKVLMRSVEFCEACMDVESGL